MGCVARKEKAAIAAGSHLFPFRTEKLSPPAPMVLRKRESRSPPPLMSSVPWLHTGGRNFFCFCPYSCPPHKKIIIRQPGMRKRTPYGRENARKELRGGRERSRQEHCYAHRRDVRWRCRYACGMRGLPLPASLPILCSA